MNVQVKLRSDLEPIETASRDELQALQLQRMKWSLKHAYDNVPHHRAKFNQAGVHPSDLKTLSDLRMFPFTYKEDLRQTYPFGMLAVPMRDVTRVHVSSGTTGKPTVVGYSARDISTWTDLMVRSLRAAGATKDDLILNSYGYGLFTGGLGAHYGAEKLGAAVIPMSGGQTEKQAQLIQDFQPTVLMSTPSYALTIADELDRQKVDPARTTLRLGLFGAEPWTNEMRREIEHRLGMDAIDMYGLSEVMGPGVACECIEVKDGLHIWEDHFYPEIIDPFTGEPVADGEPGELVFTSLTKEALPVIRYRTRDQARLLPGTARTMRRMTKVSGRTDDMIIIRGVNLFPSQVEEILLRDPTFSGQYQLHVSREGHLDKLDVLAELKPEAWRQSTPQDRTKKGRDIAHHIKAMIGVNAAVHVVDIDAIERTHVGKAKRVIDKRPK